MSNKRPDPEIFNPADRTKETGSPLSRRDRRRAETRERLYAAAVHLLSEYEFDGVTVEMITEAADVGKGTFFNYFKNKEAVVSYHFETQLRMLTDTLYSSRETVIEDCHAQSTDNAPEGGPFWRKIIAIVHEGAERRHKQKHFTRTLLSLSLTNPHVRAANVEFRARIIDTMSELIAEAQEHGEIRGDAGPDVLAGFMFAAYLGVLYMWSQSDTDENLHYLIDRAYARVWSGIRHDGEATATHQADLEFFE